MTDQFVASVAPEIDWMRSGGRYACARMCNYDLYVTPALTRSFRFVVWQRQSPHEIVAGGEADTMDAAMAEAARSLTN